MPHYESVDGVARKIVKRYEPVDNVAREVKKGYESVANVARLFFNALPYNISFSLNGTGSKKRTVHEYYRGVDGDVWRLYLDSEGATTDTDNSYSCVAEITGDLSGKHVSITCKGYYTGSHLYGADNIKLIYRQNGSWVTYYGNTIVDLLPDYVSTYFSTKETILPSGVDIVRVGVWHASAGRIQSELLISSLKIDGVELV